MRLTMVSAKISIYGRFCNAIYVDAWKQTYFVSFEYDLLRNYPFWMKTHFILGIKRVVPESIHSIDTLCSAQCSFFSLVLVRETDDRQLSVILFYVYISQNL